MKVFFLLKNNILLNIYLLSWIASCCARTIPCYILGHITLFVFLPAIPMVISQHHTTMKKHAFEDVEWQIHNEAFKERNDCYGQFIQCVRRTSPLKPICAFDVTTWYYEDFYSICHIVFENCIYTLQNGKGLLGDGNPSSYKLYHNGEMDNCVDVFRRAKSPEELDLIYFGGDKNKILAQWDKMNKQNEEVSDYDVEDDNGGYLNFN